MDSMTMAMICAEWFANDTTTQDQVEAWGEYASEGEEAKDLIESMASHPLVNREDFAPYRF